MMQTIDVSKARTSQNKFANGSLTTDRGKGLSNAGQSFLGGAGSNFRSMQGGGTRYSKLNLSTSLNEGSIAFKIGGDNIPESSTIRDHSVKEVRMNSLMRVPAHKPCVERFDGRPSNRTIVPLTYEDLGQFGDMHLIDSLREAVSPSKKAKDPQWTEPSFYLDDKMKHEKKFDKSIGERQLTKKQLAKTIDLNVRTVVNNNVNPDSDFFNLEKKINDQNLYTGGQIKPTKGSEFKRVLQRRKSRLSVAAVTTIDFDYRGDSGKCAHLIRKSAGQAEINFGMNLRNYKNDTRFTAKEAFLYPQKRDFRPEHQFEETKAKMEINNKHFKANKFTDKTSHEPNHNSLRHMRNTTDFCAVNWMVGLRDRAEYIHPVAKKGAPRPIFDRSVKRKEF